jgi:molybdopterin synthase sulfur carrier subunit
MASNTITIRFFARLREELETEALTLTVQPGLTAGGLLAELASRGGAWARLKGDQSVMIAVNQMVAKPATLIKNGDEVAFFPPVTGG